MEKAHKEIIKVLITYQSKVWCTLDHLMNHGIIEDHLGLGHVYSSSGIKMDQFY